MTGHHQAARAALRLAIPSEAALLVGPASARIVAQDQREIPRSFIGIIPRLRVFDTVPYSRSTPSATRPGIPNQGAQVVQKGGSRKEAQDRKAQSGTISAQPKIAFN